MRSFFRSLLPTYVSEKLSQEGRLEILREKLLQSMLLAVCLIGALLLIYLANQRVWFALGISAALYIVLFCITILRSQPRNTRAAVLLAAIFLLTVVFQSHNGTRFGLIGTAAGMTLLAAYFFGYIAAAGTAAAFAAAVFFFINYRLLLSLPTWPDILLSLLVMIASVAAVILTERELQVSAKKEFELSEALKTEQENLESRLNDRNLYFQRRLIEARVAAEITRAISMILDPQVLLQRVVDLMQDRFKLYYIGVFVLDADKKFAVLRAGSGEAGKKMLADGHRLAVSGTSMIGWTTLHKEPRIALDVGLEPVRFNNPHLPHTRSELALPIVAREQVLGALSVQSSQPNAFDEDDILILHGIADSLAIALENARLYQQTQETLNEIQTLNRNYLQKAWTETIGSQSGLAVQYENQTVPSADGSDEPAQVQFPLLLRDQVIGQITLESDNAILSAEDQAFVEAVMAQTAIALENTRLVQETQRRAFEEQKLNQMSEQFSQAVSVDQILKMAVRELSALPSATQVSIHLAPPQPDGSVLSQPGTNGSDRRYRGQE